MKQLRSFFTFIHIDQLGVWWKVIFVCLILCTFFLGAIPLFFQFSFYYDTARDAYEAYSIWGQGNVKILGPGTDFPGVYHGVLWYYLLALLYFVGQGNPLIAAYIYYTFLFLTIFLAGKAAYELFRNQKVAYFAMLLYAFFPLYQAFTRWLSNPVLTLLIMPLLFVSLWKYLINGGVKYIFLFAISMGIMVQSDFGFILFYLLLPLYIFIKKKWPTINEIVAFGAGSVLSLCTFIIAELKFDFRATKALLAFILEPHTASSVSATVQAVIHKYIEILQLTILPLPFWLVVSLVILVGLFLIKSKVSKVDKKALYFLAIWLTNILMFRLFNTGLTNSTFIFAPSMLAIALIGAYILVKLVKNSLAQFSVLFLIICLQLITVFSWIKENKTTLSVQHGISLYEEKKILDYTYESTNGEPFAIATVTNPLYINTLWSYLYEFIGKKEYGYLPFYEGRSQEGYLGNLPKRDSELKNYFLIIEPEAGIPYIYFSKEKYTLDQYTDVVEEKKFGNFLVQKRVYHPNKPPIDIPHELRESTVLHE